MNESLMNVVFIKLIHVRKIKLQITALHSSVILPFGNNWRHMVEYAKHTNGAKVFDFLGHLSSNGFAIFTTIYLVVLWIKASLPIIL